MNPETRHVIQAIHDCPTQTVFVTAGAGTTALSDLLSVGGASRTVLEAIVPYSTASFDAFLGQSPKRYVSSQAARLLAGRAYTRARWLSTEQPPLVGLACTAAIATDRPKRGGHRAYIVSWQPRGIVEANIVLEKGIRNRAEEEALISRLILNTLALSCNLDLMLDWSVGDGDQLKTTHHEFGKMAKRLHDGKINFFGVHAHGEVRTPRNLLPQTILAGSFNPLHKGHLALATAAMKRLDRPIAFELSAVNVDKPPIPPDVVLDRVAQFAGRYPIFVSNAPTYLDKSRLYPDATFVVGYDTAVRVLQPRYYQDSEANMMAALAEIQSRGCQFLVAGRVDQDGNFQGLDDMTIPESFTNLFQGIPDSEFRLDISSTELRSAGKRGSR